MIHDQWCLSNYIPIKHKSGVAGITQEFLTGTAFLWGFTISDGDINKMMCIKKKFQDSQAKGVAKGLINI